MVAFEIELAFEGLVDRLDDLPQRLEQVRSGPLALALAGRPQQPDVQVRELVFEDTAEVVLVADQRSARAGRRPVAARPRTCPAASRVRRLWRRSGRRRPAGRAGCTPSAGAGPRRTASGWGRTPPTPPPPGRAPWSSPGGGG